MTDPQKTVFISYRRSVTWAHARLVRDALKERGYDVFMDVDSLGPGDFEPVILKEIGRRAHFLVIVNRASLKRCEEPGDWLRREIECALDTGRNIVPVRIDDYKFQGAKKYLTGKLSRLPGINGPSLVHEFFDAAIDRLDNVFLKPNVRVEIEPPSPAEAAVVGQKMEEAASQPAPTEKELSAERLFEQAFAKYEAGDFVGAIADYTEVLRLNPNLIEAYNNRGNVRYSSGDHAGAIADFDRAIELNPQDAAAYNNRGACARSQRRPRRSHRRLRQGD